MIVLQSESGGIAWNRRNTPQRKQSGVADGRTDASVQGTRSP